MLVNNRWIRASGELNDKPISIQYREDWQQAAAYDVLNICVQIAWQAESRDESTGFPSDAEQLRILAFSEQLQQVLEADENAVVAMVIAHDGVNQWIIYCKDLQPLKDGLDKIPASDAGYPLEVVADEDPHWQIFQQVYDAIRQQH